MEVGCSDAKWTRLIQTIDDGIRTVALNANVYHEELRHRYIMTCLHVTEPFEYSKYNIANTVVKQKTEIGGSALNMSTAGGTATATLKYKGTLAEQIAAGDNITMQSGKDGSQPKTCQNATNSYNKVHLQPVHAHQQQQQQLNGGSSSYSSSNQKTVIRQRSQQSFYTRTVRGSSVPPYRAPVAITAANHVCQASATVNSCKAENGNGTNGDMIMMKTTQPKILLQSKDLKNKKVAKFYCDIEAALAGEISDVEDVEEATVVRCSSLGKPSSGNGALRTSASLAKETISLVEAQLKKIKQPETRIVRYPNGKPLALNVLHKIYVVEVESTHAWVRLCDGERPPCFDAAHVAMKALKPLEWEELLPGTPCVVLARFNPLDVVNDGIARELTEFESHARAVVEECHSATKTVTVRLVDFGFRLTQLAAAAIKPLTIAFDGPPLALRLQFDFLPKQQKESLCRHVILCVRLTVARDKQFLCWPKTWKAIDAQKQIWNKDSSDCSSSLKSIDIRNLKDQHCASSSFGPVARAFVSSWLNKDHKRAGGRGIEAALCGIAERRSDLPPSEFAMKAVNNDFAGKGSLQSTQSSSESEQLALSAAASKMDDEWPVLTRLPKTIKVVPPLPMLKKKEHKRKERKWFALKDESAGVVHNQNQPVDYIRDFKAAIAAETANEISNAQLASSSVTTVQTCRDLL